MQPRQPYIVLYLIYHVLCDGEMISSVYDNSPINSALFDIWPISHMEIRGYLIPYTENGITIGRHLSIGREYGGCYSRIWQLLTGASMFCEILWALLMGLGDPVESHKWHIRPHAARQGHNTEIRLPNR